MAQKRRGRYNIYIDGHYSFSVSENVLIEYQLLKGMDIDADQLESLKQADQIDRSYQKAINYLAHRLRTRHEVVQYLKKDEVNDDTIDLVIERLVQNHLIDDRNYADSYIRSEVRMQDKGPNTITQYLKRKGIDEHTIEHALAEIYSDQLVIENGVHQAQKLFQHYQHDAYQKAIQKVKTALVRKGYRFESINSIMDQVDLSFDSNQETQLLKRQFERVWRKNRHYDPTQRILKTKQNLYRKGFAFDAINKIIDQYHDQ